MPSFVFTFQFKRTFVDLTTHEKNILVQKIKTKNITVLGQNLAVLVIVLRRLPLRYVFNRRKRLKQNTMGSKPFWSCI